MSTTAIPETVATPDGVAADGFGNDATPVVPPPAAPAAPATKEAPKAAEVKTEPAKAGDGSLLGTPEVEYDLKADGMHADDLKLFGKILGENKVDGKAGQAILDKLRPALKARADADLAAAQVGWRAENAKDATSSPRIEAALSVVSKETREALRNEVYIDHPALYRFVAEMGAFVQKATKQDTTVGGAPPATASTIDPANTSAAAFAGGMSGF